MKVLLLLGLSLVTFGCGNYPTLEELEAEALITGDWRAVERREAVIAKREARSGPNCPKDYMAYCESSMAYKRCTCVQKGVMAGLLYGR